MAIRMIVEVPVDGKLTSQPTVAEDSDDTLVTKGYVDELVRELTDDLVLVLEAI